MRRPQGSIRIRKSSLPIPLGERDWNGFVLGAVCATAGIATWSFVVGGASAFYLNAKMGAAAMLAGGLIGQLLVTLATVPPSTKHGIETVISTKPQLGTRGSYIALFMQYATALGWNAVLMIFFGRSAASVLVITGLIDSSARSTAATALSAAGVVLVWVMVSRGASSLQKAGPVIAITISLMSVYLLVVLFRAHGFNEIFSAAPLDPAPSRLLNYTSVIELLIVSTWGWWSYMGGMVRMVNTGRKAVLPSMLGLGVAWVVVAIVSLYSSLVTGEPDPTVWAPEIAGQFGGVVVLLFVAFANIGSTLVGAYVATLGVSQIPQVSSRMSWRVVAAVVLSPMLLVVLFFATEFFENVDRFMAFIGLMIAPVVGVQIADWYLLGRRKTMRVSGLYRHNRSSCYWYLGGFNPAGVIALVLGSVTYQLLLNPVTYEPRSPLFKYLTASLPAVLVAAVVYTLLSLLWRGRLDRSEAEQEPPAEPAETPVGPRP
ncbi:cytosine permease [Streptomyces sp. TP-A0874]|uniref:cytosine permease n=1 Tax=Streptomyces sp. TP-A0874 TaxID=549819 RepID=UPI000852BFE3|nr:cytosine permease [Streptomyces sp. TP-A0874]